MPLTNYTKNVQIAEKVEIADSFFSRFKGLLGRTGLPVNHCLIINPCNSIHTCFMKFNIDVIFVDSEGTVVNLMENVAPFRFSSIVRKSRYVIELPVGTIIQTGIEMNDKLNVSDLNSDIL